MKNTGKENQNNLDPVVISPLKNTLRKILWVLKEIAIALFIAFLITHFVACRGVVVGHSMDNTLYDGENFIVDRFSYNISEPQRFDIVVIEHPRLGCIIKRVVGLPGETVQINGSGEIYINGEKLEENYGKEIIRDAGAVASPIALGENQYFVLGDNRNNSTDSRIIGPIDKSEIIGKLCRTLNLYIQMEKKYNGNRRRI